VQASDGAHPLRVERQARLRSVASIYAYVHIARQVNGKVINYDSVWI
jgi:hypothetical protein